MARSVFIAIPTHSGNIESETAVALSQTAALLARLDIPHSIHVRARDSIIPQARNVLVGEFLRSEATDLFFIDADISFSAADIIRLLAKPVDLVAGAYRFKKEPEDYPIRWLDKPELWADPETGLLEVEAAPMGFCRLSRAGIDRMVEAHRDRAFTVHDAPGVQCHCLFDLEFRDGQYFGEDYVFCRRWRDLGGQVWIDPGLSLSHSGYSGNIGHWLKSRGT